MSKNKLIWNIALILTVIASLPAAHAQAFTDSRWFYVIINSLIVGVVLFILQMFLVTQKSGKEQTAAWVAIIAGSLLIGFFFGQEGFIWSSGRIGQFFSNYTWYVLLANTAIIAIVLYFLMGLLDVNKKLGGSTEGKTGLWILIFIIALVFAVKIGDMWIWDLRVVVQLKDYLFGEFGILNPDPPAYRLWTFIAVGTLLAFFFEGYLLKGGAGGTHKINYALAIILASNVARAGISLSSVVLLGEAIFTIVLAEALKGTAPTVKGFGTNWILAAFLVGWASAAMTYGEKYQGILAGIIGAPLWAMGLISAGTTGAPARPTDAGSWFGWIGKMGIGALVIALLFLLLFFLMFRGENRRRILTLAVGGFKKSLSAILGFGKFVRSVPKDREPQVLIENRLLLHANVAYVTRAEITYRYKGFVEEAIAVGGELAKKVIKQFKDPVKLRKDIIAYRTSGTTSEGIDAEGWNRLNLEVVNLVNELFEVMYRVYISAQFGFKPFNTYKAESNQFVRIQARAGELLRRLQTAKSEYDLRATGEGDQPSAYGGHHVIRAYRNIILDMANPEGGGVLEKTYKFAKPNAEFVDKNGNVVYRAQHDVNGRPVDEVNQYGELVADIVKQKDKFGNLPSDPRLYNKPRKLKNPNDAIDYPDFLLFFNYVDKEWKGLAEDIRFGIHHPKSRNVQNYIDALKKKIYPEWADEKIPYTTGPRGDNPAFDMRALADPGSFIYWGREKFDSEAHVSYDAIRHDPHKGNSFPALSSLGLKKYLQTRIRLDIRPTTLAEEHMKKIIADRGAPKKDLKAGLKIGGRLHEDAYTPPQGG